MNIVCVAACTAGIAHTYIAREKLILKLKLRALSVLKMSYWWKIFPQPTSLFLRSMSK